MSTKYIIVEKEPEGPGCFVITVIIILGISLIYGVYKLIKMFITWITSINPYSIALFFCTLALIAVAFFFFKYIYKYYKYRAIKKNLTFLKEDLSCIEETYQGLNLASQHEIDAHIKELKKLEDQISSRPELGIELNFELEAYTKTLESMSQAVTAKGQLLTSDSLEEEAYQRTVNYQKYLAENNYQKLRELDFCQIDKDIERIESYTGTTKAEVKTALEYIAEGDLALQRFQNYYYRKIKTFLNINYNNTIEKFQMHFYKGIPLYVLFIILIGSIILFSFNKIKWDEQKAIAEEQAILEKQKAEADQIIAEQLKLKQELKQIEEKLKYYTELEIINDEFELKGRKELIVDTPAKHNYSNDKSWNITRTIENCGKDRNDCCENGQKEYLEFLSRYKREILILILNSKKEPQGELFTRFDNVLFEYVQNNADIKNHPRYKAITNLKISNEEISVLYLMWMLRHCEYGINDTYSDLYPQQNYQTRMDTYYEAQKLMDQFHSRFEDTSLYQCPNKAKNKKKKDTRPKVQLL